MSRAGFIPQMFSFQVLNTRTVFKLLSKYDGKAIIHHPDKTALLAESKTTLPCHIAVDYLSVTDTDVADLELPELPETNAEDLTFIFQSSGSVSDLPKVVPTTNKWLSAIENKVGPAFCIGDFKTQDVYVWTCVHHYISLWFLIVVFIASPSPTRPRSAVCLFNPSNHAAAHNT